MAAPIPIEIPAAVNRRLWRKTKRTTSRGCAPSAIRILSSRVRNVTNRKMTPDNPISVRETAAIANVLIRITRNVKAELDANGYRKLEGLRAPTERKERIRRVAAGQAA